MISKMKLRFMPTSLLTKVAGVVALVWVGLTGLLGTARLGVGQESMRQHVIPAWQSAAGGKMSFEVASVRQSKPGTVTPANFGMDISDSFEGADPNGRFTADYTLATYIQFAYKLWLSRGQMDSMLAHLPKWVSTDNFEINARVEGKPTKDQMRLMLQSLLADRFKLAVHFVSEQVPALALVLEKPGKLGPKLHPHSEGPSCDLTAPVQPQDTPTNHDDAFPQICDQYLMIPKPNRAILVGSRNTTIDILSTFLTSLGRLDHPVVDQTGLSGRFDFTLEFTPESKSPLPPDQDIQPEPQETTLQEALDEQLGLKLKSTRAPLDVLVIDHVEEPSPN